MTVKERLMELGEFTVTLDPSTPLSIRSQLDYFGHILITRAHIDPTGFTDAGMKAQAIFAGVIREEAGRFLTIGGHDLAFWLGDEDGKGNVLETAVTETTGSFSTWFNALINSNDLTVGTVHTVSGAVTATYQYVTPRAALEAICSLFGAEYRVNPDGTVDAGLPADLFQAGKAMAVKMGTAGDLNVAGLKAAAIGRKQDVYDYTTKTALVVKGEASTVETGAATAATGYKNFKGNTPVFTRLVDGSQVDPANAATAAQAELNLYSGVRRAISLSTDMYAVTRKAKPGDSIYVYDPEQGLVDNTVEVPYQGQLLHPMLLRVYAITWPVERGMGVYFRDLNGGYVDLTPYVAWETGAASFEVASSSRQLGTTGGGVGGVQAVTPASAGSVITSTRYSATPGGTSDYNNTTYVDHYASITLPKKSGSSVIQIRGTASGFVNTAGLVPTIGFHVNGTDYDAGHYYFNATFDHRTFGFNVEISGVPAGNITIQPRIKVVSAGGANHYTVDGGDQIEYTAQEVL